MKIRTLLIFLALSVYVANPIIAQAEFVEGFILTNEEDTIPGLIEYSYKIASKNGDRCLFKATAKDSVQTFLPFDIVGYGLKDSKYYRSKKINSGARFLQGLSTGQLNIYFDQNKTGSHYYIEKEGLGLNELTFKESIKRVEGKSFLKLSKDHQGMLRYYMGDAPSLFGQIEKMERPTHQALINLSRSYHALMGQEEDFEVLLEKGPDFSFYIAPFIGYEAHYNKLVSSTISPLTYGLFFKLKEKTISEKINIKAGIIFAARYEVEDLRLQLQRVPILIEYEFPMKGFDLSLSVGYNFFNLKILDQDLQLLGRLRRSKLIGTIGGSTRINQKWRLYAEYWLIANPLLGIDEFSPNISEDIMSGIGQNFIIGFSYRL